MSGDIFLDVERLIFDAMGAFRKAQTSDELDAAYARLVKPVHNQLSENANAILEMAYSTNLTILLKGLRD